MFVIENTGQATPTDPNICYSSPDSTASQFVSEISTAAAILIKRPQASNLDGYMDYRLSNEPYIHVT
jgi:hypothetical protein